MTGVPSSTWFSAAPHWEWLIAIYFFLGGLAGGSYFLSALIDLFGTREHRPLAHLGYYVAFPCLALSGLLLAVDLGRPLRAWHMFIQSNTYRPMFKYWSPMSIGSWALAILGFFAFLSFLAALAEDGRIRWSGLRRLRAPSPVGRVIAVLGGFFGFYVAGYTGVLLAVTNRPIWSDTPLLGLLFIAAGLYQVTPLKNACLSSCRSPFDFVVNHWRDGAGGALRMGFAHGLYCLGCCWILMALLFAVGAMNLVWVAALAIVVLVEKLFPGGAWITPPVALIGENLPIDQHLGAGIDDGSGGRYRLLWVRSWL